MKLGVLTLPVAGNYGGMLQAYAMVKILTECGHEAALLEYLPLNFQKRFKKWDKRIGDAIKSFLFKHHLVSAKTKTPFPIEFEMGQQFRRKYIPAVPLSLDANHIQYPDELDGIVVGSDQVWRGRYIRAIHSIPFFFLDFVPERIRRNSVSYAASFGSDTWEGNESDTAACRQLLRDFKAISVREHSGCNICRDHFDAEAQQVPDPTMLLTPSHYNELIASEPTWIPDSDYLGSYVLDNSGKREAELRKVARAEALPLVRLNSSTASVRKHIKYPIVPAQWLRFIRDCKYLITDSFHGCVFAIIFNKPFVCLGNKKRGTARFDALLSTYGLEDRLIFDAPADTIQRTLASPIDWHKVNAIRAAEQMRGIDFLRRHLPLQ